MTDITLGLPIGAFYWRGYIPGQLVGAQIDWECDYSSTEPVAIPPFIDYIGQHVVVTNWLPDCESVPSHVSPGVLTLTPTVTCPNPDPEGDPIVTVLDPLYLTIVEGGCSASAPACVDTLCPFPENPGFESGLASWDYSGVVLDTGTVNTGVNSAKLTAIGSYVGQEKSGACPKTGTLGLRCEAYRAGTIGTVSMTIEQYDGTTLLDSYNIPSINVFPDAWRRPAISQVYHPDMNKVKIRIEANDANIFIDDVYVDYC